MTAAKIPTLQAGAAALLFGQIVARARFDRRRSHRTPRRPFYLQISEAELADLIAHGVEMGLELGGARDKS